MSTNPNRPRPADCDDAIVAALRQLGGVAHRHAIVVRAKELGNFTTTQRVFPAPPSQLDVTANDVGKRQSRLELLEGDVAIAHRVPIPARR